MKRIPGGVTTPQGFLANGMSAGIKKSGKPDLALIYSKLPAVSTSVFTKNSVKAAPLQVCQAKMKYKKVQAIVVNSGNANCFTGSFGLLYAKKTTEIIAKLLQINDNYVLVASTGIIGKPLPFNKIEDSAPELTKGLSSKNGQKAARAILTTDKKIKEIAVEISLDGKKIKIGGCAKGSGMIQPNMATMLAFITTDCVISHGLLKKALQECVQTSFNSITVDGCMSTNDMVTVMANGLAGNTLITEENKNYSVFKEALNDVCLYLAKQIVWDAEGATKFVVINVSGAQTKKQAKDVAMAIANSNLVKCAAFGSDPNWGRVAAAVGSLGLNVTEKNLKIKFSSFKKKEIKINVDLNLGKSESTVYTADLSFEYVKINGRYN